MSLVEPAIHSAIEIRYLRVQIVITTHSTEGRECKEHVPTI